MLLLAGATGEVGSALLRRLTADRVAVRCLAHPPRRLRDLRVRVQIAIGDLAEQAVQQSAISSVIFAPSLVYALKDRWLTLLERLALLPALPLPGDGSSLYQPLWAEDVLQGASPQC